MADYFSQTYGKEVRDFDQPLIQIKVQEQYIYIPPEFVLIDGVPDAIRKSPGMRDALAMTRVSPNDKMGKIKEMCESLFSQKAIEKWGFTIDTMPISLQNTVLSCPKIVSSNQVIHCSEKTLRN